jgi:hypothetical protein
MMLETKDLLVAAQSFVAVEVIDGNQIHTHHTATLPQGT